MRRRRKRWLLFLLLPGLLLLFGSLALGGTSPVLEELAAAELKRALSETMNDAIINCLNEDEIHYQDLILIQRDSEGGIQALQTNMREVNRLKSQIVSEGNQSLLKLKEQSIGVPLGNLFFPALFSGDGPVIPVHLINLISVSADFSHSFSQAGINQTLHRISICMRSDCSALVLGKTIHVTAETEVLAAETVLLGEVPQTYVSIDHKGG